MQVDIITVEEENQSWKT